MYAVVPDAPGRPTEDAALSAIEQAERRAAVNRALESLDARYRHILKRWLNGATYIEIAHELDTTTDAVSGVLHRARGMLREMLAQWRTEEAISYRGIWSQGKQWQATIHVRDDNGKLRTLHLGRFTTAREAARAFDAAALKYHGEKARLNFPPAAAVAG